MTITRKKLIETGLPLEAINAASAREKSIRHGHPSTLHLWWARRPLAAARAVIFAQMVDDPKAVPEEFPTEEAQNAERQRLFRLIEQLVLWENTTNETVLQAARDEIWRSWRRACEQRREERGESSESWTAEEIAADEALFNPQRLPPFHDPFAGGGSLPLEAQRLGLEAYASDLNPVAVLINKAMIEIPPKFAGRPPVNPENSKQLFGNSHALSRPDGVEQVDGTRSGGVSARPTPATRRDIRDALANHEGSGISPGEHRGGLDAGIGQGEGAVSGDSARFFGGDGDTADSLRVDRLVSNAGDGSAAQPAGGGWQDADSATSQIPREQLTPISYPLFPTSYKGAAGLAEDVRYYGKWMRDEAERRIGHLYPKIEVTAEMAQERPDLKPYVGQRLTVIAWLWARTVKSPNPAFAHVDVPLASTFMLSTKPGKEAYVEPVILGAQGARGAQGVLGARALGTRALGARASGPHDKEDSARASGPHHGEADQRSAHPAHPAHPSALPAYRFTVKVGKPPDPEAAKRGTTAGKRSAFKCLMSGVPITYDHIRAEGKAGRMGARLMAIVAEGERGRVYLAPTPEHEAAALRAKPEWKPDVRLEGKCRVNVSNYGFDVYGDLFTPRQLVALTTFSDLVGEAMERVKRDALLGARGALGELGARASGPHHHEEEADGARASGPHHQEEADQRSAHPASAHPASAHAHRGWHSRGYHPHFDAPGAVQSITFRLHDSVPAELLERWRAELEDSDRGVKGSGPEARAPSAPSAPSAPNASDRARALRERIAAYEDAGHGECWLRDPRIAALVENALLHFDGQRYRLLEWCIMPNHVHVLIETIDGYPLSDVVRSWKTYTAREANRLLGRDGPFWMADYYDRFVRDEQHLEAVREYIRMNPVKAGLCAAAEEWPWSSARALGALGARASGPHLGGAPARGESGPEVRAPERAPDRAPDDSGPHDEEDGARASGPQGSGPEVRAPERAPERAPDDLTPLSQGGTGAAAYAEAVGVYLACAVDRLADRVCSLATWQSSADFVRGTFGRQALPMVWDFADVNPFSSSTGNFLDNVGWVAEALDSAPVSRAGTAVQADAASPFLGARASRPQALGTSAHPVVSTDPPYYDNIGYADLSDFFYVWLRRSLHGVFPELFATVAVPKAEELVATPYRHGSREKAERFFLDGMTKAMGRLAEQAHPAFPVTIYYAFKQAETPGTPGARGTLGTRALGARASGPPDDEEEKGARASGPPRQEADQRSAHPSAHPKPAGVVSTGWETFLDAVIRAGFSVTGTLPMRTERSVRTIGLGTNALASSIVLVCRQRADDAPTATRAEFLQELSFAMREALPLMTNGQIAPVDLAQASIGPGMAVYSKYSRVLRQDGKPVTVREALQDINNAISAYRTERTSSFDPKTRFCLDFYEQFGFAQGEFDNATVLARAQAVGVDTLENEHLLVAERGKAWLVPLKAYPVGVDGLERAFAGSAWEACMRLAVTLQEKGDGETAALARQLGEGVCARARELAVWLYTIADARKRAEDALAFNALDASWPEIQRLMASMAQGEQGRFA